jgi:hypothetical protein
MLYNKQERVDKGAKAEEIKNKKEEILREETNFGLLVRPWIHMMLY